MAALLLPALLAWVSSGAACVTMAHGAPAPTNHAAHGESHAAHHSAHHTTPQSVSRDAPCPHCPSNATVAATAHACATADGAAIEITNSPLPDVKPLLVATNWVPLPATPAPPLIRFAALPRGAIPANVPLHIRHCVLLI